MTANYVVPLPGAGLSALIGAALADAGYRLSGPAPGGVRVTWHRRSRAGLAQDVVLVYMTGGWDLRFADALSRRTGGYAIAWDPADGRTAALYAGHTLAMNDGIVASRYLEQVSVWSLSLLDVADAGEAGAVDAVPPPGGPRSRGRSPRRMAQVGLTCGEEALRGTTLPDGWRFRAGRVPEADGPFVLLRGAPPVDPEWLGALALQTSSYAAAVELAGPDDAVPWFWATPDGEVTTGIARTGAEVIEVWRDLSTVLGTYPATFQWPVTD